MLKILWGHQECISLPPFVAGEKPHLCGHGPELMFN